MPNDGASDSRTLRGTVVVEDLAVEVPAHLVGHLLGEVLARVDHGQHDALDAQPGVQRFADQADRALQIGQPLERVVLALQRHQHGVGGGQRVQRQQAQRGRVSMRTKS